MSTAALNVARKYGVDTNPTPAQSDAGNYKKKHIVFQGIPISIENPKGTIRRGINNDGKPWANRMAADYGYIKRTTDKDGDQVDVFVGPNKTSDRVFIVDQLHHHMKKFDEHKCILGFSTRKQALTAYHNSYGRVYGTHHTVGGVTEMSIEAFKEWLKGSSVKRAPVAPDVPMKRGGAVNAKKSTKAEAHYRAGSKSEHCAICSMFRQPNSCTAVEGHIRPQDTCDYFEHKDGMAAGGKTRKYTMPLKKGSSKAVVSENISEFHTGPTYAHTKAKFGKARADAQAVAAAMSSARRYGKKKAFGGPNIESMIEHGSIYGLRHEGMINSAVPGRTDKLPMGVRAGSYVLPADIPSALGQGNSMAGGQILSKMFSSGPYGMAAPRGGGRPPRMPRMRMAMPGIKQPKIVGFAEGGDAEDKETGGNVDIIAAGGEFVVPPEVVRDIGHGSVSAGHKVLDKFVLHVRKKHIDTLKNLPGPKK